MNAILYMFITCEARIGGCYDRIQSMMKELGTTDFIVVKGGSDRGDCYDDATRILHLACNDFYEGLPEKVIKSFKFICESRLFGKYTHVCKLDDDVKIQRLLSDPVYDYCGVVDDSRNGNRRWHIGRCSKTSKFNNTIYTGKFVPWCLGGNGYIVSVKCLAGIIHDTNYDNEIYEDAYVAKLLHKNKVYPTNMNIKDYVYSKDH